MDDVRRCLDSLAQELQGIDAETLVVDNASTEKIPEMIEAGYPWVDLTRWQENRGLGPALRFLADRAKGEWVLLLDSDTVLQPGCLKGLLEFAAGKPGLAAVAPAIRGPEGDIQMTARRFPGPWNALFGRQTLLSKIWPGNLLTRRYLRAADREGDAPFQCDWVAFAAALVRRRAMEECDSIDPGFFVYWIDADFFRRIRKAKWEVWCLPTVEALHLEYNRPDRVRSPLGIKDFHRGAFRYFRKNHGWGGLNPLLAPAALGLFVRQCLHLSINRRRMRRQ
jgi:GT2 family glycosyltransferase